MTSIYQIDRKSGFSIEIDNFSGPISILAELIQKKKLSIYEVSLSSIIKDFLKYIKKNKGVLLEELSVFLYVATLLLEIKAGSLIPSKNNTDDSTEENDDLEILRQREKEYKAFREISEYFSELIEKESIYYIREAPLEDQFFGFFPEIFKSIKMIDLYNMASRLLTSKEEKISLAAFYKERVMKTIFQEIDRIKVILNKKEDVTFKELTCSYSNLIDIVICFLSILELYKNEFIEIEQFELFGEILIKKISI
ncbi:MAG: segregation/condensation protein A [Actinobacteria bacterium]|nr:segregation/condensation protein A [Actinomycetota bacterium]